MPHVLTEDLQISFMETGAQRGKAVLLLHGWPDDATTWNAIVERLRDRRLRFVIPYLRGFGPTTFRNDSRLRTANGGILAMDAIALMDGLGIEQFSVVGHDWGSHVAECLAIGWPDRIERIGQLSSPPRMGGLRTPSFRQSQLFWYQWFMATKRGAEAIAKDRRGFARIQWENWAPDGWFDEATFDAVATSFENPDWLAVTLHSYRVRWEEADADPRSVWLEDKVKETKSLSLPAVFIQGEQDGVTPPAMSEDVHRKFAGPFERILLQNVGHFPQREDPETVSRELAVFLEA
ncbi:alpha/beta hydrolase [Rhizobium cauense]|uniref:alpha/beta fold hydrolase n=1 Tax=Rhizobium cauense TaxID=1166683 RepID=UPI001C6E77DB|nr:alpha/beta hydrolase [Rhizobium cauense]MBW9115610.1 alpha/beta hydrolase [Rhizobium cauense]